MDFTKLTKTAIFTTLTEADDKYDIPDNVYDGTPAEEAPVNDEAETEPAENQNTDTPAQPTDETEEQNQTDETQDDNQEEITDEQLSPAELRNGIPDIQVLSTMSDSEYKLCNSKCFDDFRELQKMVETVINNNIIDIRTNTDKERQAIEILHNNFSKMIDDIQNYILYRFSSIYETNVVAYLTFLKRYQAGLRVIEAVNKSVANN